MIYLLNIWEFVYFVCGLSPPKRRVVRRQNFARRRVLAICRTSAGFYVYTDQTLTRSRCYQKMTFFTKITCSRRTSQQLLIALLLIAQNAYGATSCLHACWAGVSQPSSHSLNQAVAATARKVIIIIIITSCPPTASSRHGSFDCDYQITRMVQFGGQEKHHKTRSIQVKHHQSAGRQMTTASSWICHTWQSLLCNTLNTFKHHLKTRLFIATALSYLQVPLKLWA